MIWSNRFVVALFVLCIVLNTVSGNITAIMGWLTALMYNLWLAHIGHLPLTKKQQELTE